jgi:hypothetical protein
VSASATAAKVKAGAKLSQNRNVAALLFAVVRRAFPERGHAPRRHGPVCNASLWSQNRDAQKVGRHADLLRGDVDQCGDGAIAEQMGPNALSKAVFVRSLIWLHIAEPLMGWPNRFNQRKPDTPRWLVNLTRPTKPTYGWQRNNPLQSQ